MDLGKAKANYLSDLHSLCIKIFGWNISPRLLRLINKHVVQACFISSSNKNHFVNTYMTTKHALIVKQKKNKNNLASFWQTLDSVESMTHQGKRANISSHQ